MKRFTRYTSIVLVIAMTLTGCGAKDIVTSTDNNTSVSVSTEASVGASTETSTETSTEISTEISTETSTSTVSVPVSAEPETEETVYLPLRDAVSAKIDGIIGCCLNSNTIKNKDIWEIVTTDFSAITFENELKPQSLLQWGSKCTEITTAKIGRPSHLFVTIESILSVAESLPAAFFV